MAHAVARHSSEKLSLGIFLTVASQLAFQVFQVYVRRKQGPTQGRGPGGGAQGIPVAWYATVASLRSSHTASDASNLSRPKLMKGGRSMQCICTCSMQCHREASRAYMEGSRGSARFLALSSSFSLPSSSAPFVHVPQFPIGFCMIAWLHAHRGQPQRGGYGMSNARGGYGGRGGGGRGGGGGGPGGLLLNPQVIGIFTNLFLQLPFSRRAEAEADLIGLKLMGLAGYNPQVSHMH